MLELNSPLSLDLQVGYNESVSLRHWYTDGAAVDLACYFWCTPNGNIPKLRKPDFNQVCPVIHMIITSSF